MSQEQPQRHHEDHKHKPIKYGDVFSVQGEIAQKPVAPRDAALMQAAETAILGQTQKGGVAAAMQSAAIHNEQAGLVSHNDSNSLAADQSVIVVEKDHSGRRIVSKAVAGQGPIHARSEDEKKRNILKLVEVLAGKHTQRGYMTPTADDQKGLSSSDISSAGITIGEALEATAMTAGQKLVEWSDAAAIQAAEVRATGRTNIVPGGVAAAAQSAATLNARATRDEDKTKLADVLTDATSKLPADKPATRRDAEGVTGAEMRNDPFLTTHPLGVAASVAAAARLNQCVNQPSK